MRAFVILGLFASCVYSSPSQVRSPAVSQSPLEYSHLHTCNNVHLQILNIVRRKHVYRKYFLYLGIVDQHVRWVHDDQ